MEIMAYSNIINILIFLKYFSIHRNQKQQLRGLQRPIHPRAFHESGLIGRPSKAMRAQSHGCHGKDEEERAQLVRVRPTNER